MSSTTAVLKFPSGIKSRMLGVSTNRILLSDKKEHIPIEATTLKDLKIIRLPERNQMQKSRYYMIPFV